MCNENKEAAMPVQVSTKPSVDPARIGECAAMQPLSGIKSVDETFAVNGLGRGAYVRTEKTDKNGSQR
jgi:hypothetical protein